MPRLSQQIWRFVLFGTIGFLIDASVVSILVHGAKWQPLEARIPSFLLAATFTWWSNRTWNFAPSQKQTQLEWILWVLAMLLGATLNFFVYWLAMSEWTLARDYPALGVAMGSLAGMVANFFTAKFWIMGK